MTEISRMVGKRWALGLTILSGGGLVALSVPLWAPTSLSTALENVPSVLGLIESRSPGPRTRGQLIKVKGEPASAEPLASQQLIERALGKEFPGASSAPGEIAALPPEFPALALPGIELPLPAEVFGSPIGANGPAAFIPAVLVGGGGGGGGGGSGGMPGGSGGSGGQGPGGPDLTPIIVPLTAVPEADTWAMMVMGLGLCGYALRRRTASRKKRPCAIS